MDTAHRLPHIWDIARRAILGAVVLIFAGTLLAACTRTIDIPATATVASNSGARAPNSPRAGDTSPRASDTPDARKATQTARRDETPTPRPATVVATLIAGNLGVAPVKDACPADHAIKGRIDKKQQTYYPSSSRDYTHTKPEICFATEADAQTAGFQAAAK